MKKRKDMELKADYKAVANILKLMVNQNCKEGFKWYPEADPKLGANIFSINQAIKLLENTKSEGIRIEET